jgi:hypothetical protein
VSFPPVIPPDTRAPGYSGHIVDHNSISDALSWLTAQVTQLGQAVAGSVLASSQQTGNYTLQAADLGTVVEVNSGAAATVTIPPSSQAAFPVGAVIWVCATGSGTVTIAAGTGVTLLAAPSPPYNITAQYAEAKLRQRALNTWVMTGSVT